MGGAGTIVNAMATGRGVAFGLRFQAHARIHPDSRWTVFDAGRRLSVERSRLAIESARAVLGEAPHRIDVACNIPMERGLKSSSAVSLAVIEACLRAARERWSAAQRLRAAAEAGLRSGTSLTGAYDDAAACLLGGVVATDNRRRRILRRSELPRGLSALVRAPPRRRTTASVRGTDFRSIRAQVEEAFRLALRGRVGAAMEANTDAYARAFRLRPRFSAAAREVGCFAAGLSGKGPAEVAIGRPDALSTLARRFLHVQPVALRRGRAA